jgi:hypothetical protein
MRHASQPIKSVAGNRHVGGGGDASSVGREWEDWKKGNEKPTYLTGRHRDWPANRNCGGRKPRDAGGEPIGDWQPRGGIRMLSERTGWRFRSFGIVDSAVCGPIGGGEVDSHGCVASTNLPVPPRVGRRAISQLECRGTVQIAPVERFGARRSVWISSGRAISNEGRNSHDCYAFLIGKGNRKPGGGPEKDSIKDNTFYLWGGNPTRAAASQGSEPDQYGNPVFPLTSGQPPVGWMKMPP